MTGDTERGEGMHRTHHVLNWLAGGFLGAIGLFFPPTSTAQERAAGRGPRPGRTPSSSPSTPPSV